MSTPRSFQPAAKARTPAADQAAAQFLELAKLANVHFEVVEDRLVMCAARMDWKLWSTLRRYLDEIGVPAIADYLRRTGPVDRARLAAAA